MLEAAERMQELSAVRSSFWRGQCLVFSLYLGLLFTSICIAAVRYLSLSPAWNYGDWLINYTAGFVRRGFLGEIFVYGSGFSHIPLMYFAVITPLVLYAVLFSCAIYLAARIRMQWWMELSLFSPATFGFFVVSSASLHKEVLYFAGLALLMVLLHGRVVNRLSETMLVCSASVFFVVGVLTHELIFFYLPYFAAAVYIWNSSVLRTLRLILIPFSLATLALFAVATHKGNSSVATHICTSLGQENRRFCGGSIAYLGRSQSDARQDALSATSRFHFAAIYPLPTLLAFLPLGIALSQLRRRGMGEHANVILLAALISAVLSVVLFRYGTDWGRWLQIHVLSILLLVMFAEGQHPAHRFAPITKCPKLLLLIYSVCWSLPMISVPVFGYLSWLHRAIEAY